MGAPSLSYNRWDHQEIMKHGDVTLSLIIHWVEIYYVWSDGKSTAGSCDNV